MTDDQAQRLAEDIISTWPTGPRRHIWKRALLRVEHDTAQTVYRNLATRQEHPPSIASFRNACARIDNPTPTPAQIDADAISLSDYIALLVARTDAGNTTAAHELARWERMLDRDDQTA
jgi:hypothetical protein